MGWLARAVVGLACVSLLYGSSSPAEGIGAVGARPDGPDIGRSASEVAECDDVPRAAASAPISKRHTPRVKRRAHHTRHGRSARAKSSGKHRKWRGRRATHSRSNHVKHRRRHVLSARPRLLRRTYAYFPHSLPPVCSKRAHTINTILGLPDEPAADTNVEIVVEARRLGGNDISPITLPRIEPPAGVRFARITSYPTIWPRLPGPGPLYPLSPPPPVNPLRPPIAPVPEPSSWFLMLVGFAMVGLMTRKRSVMLNFIGDGESQLHEPNLAEDSGDPA